MIPHTLVLKPGLRARSEVARAAAPTGGSLETEAASALISTLSELQGTTERDKRRHWQYLDGMASSRPATAYDRVAERRRAVALVRHFRDAEGLSITQIAERLCRSPSTVKAHFLRPDK